MTEEEEVNEILWEQRLKELAAPEMYEALKWLVDGIDDDCKAPGYLLAVRALAKAEGKS